MLHGDPGDGTELVQFTCHGGGTQQFVFRKGANGSFAIQSVLTGKFADVDHQRTDNGIPVNMYGANNAANQQWTAVQLTTA